MKKIQWWEPVIGDSEGRLIAEVLESNFVNDGAVTTAFEARVAALTGCKHAVAVTSGTCALFCAMATLDIGHGDEVVVPDSTFIATVNAVSMTGATPVLADIDPLSLTLYPESFERVITPRTKAVIPVHVSGRSADLAAIGGIAEAHDVEVIEDAAEAFMSKVGGRFLGTVGRLGCLSFSPLKIITTGQGGMVLTNDDDLHRLLLQLKDQGRPVRGTAVDIPIPTIGYNFKFTNIQAALGLGQLENLDWRMKRLTRHYRGFAEGLAGIDQVVLPGFRTEEGELPLWTDILVERRDKLHAFLGERNIDCRPFWKPIHSQPCYQADGARFPATEEAMSRALWLPAAFSLNEEDIVAVCDAIGEFYEA